MGVRLTGLVLIVVTSSLLAQAPLPDPGALVKEIEAHQRRMDEIRESYTFHEVTVTDELDARGGTGKTTSEESDVFFVNGYRVARLVKKNGRELTEAEKRAEGERVRKLVEKHLKAPPGHSFNRRGENAGIGRILPLMKISNPRRLTYRGRSTLAYDFIGDPHAHAEGIAESAARKIAGTVWIDETDHEVSRLEAHFDDNFRIGGGLLATIQKGTSLVFEQAPAGQDTAGDKGEVLWMPTISEIHLSAREFMVKGVRQNIHVRDTDFRRFDIGVSQQVAPPH